MAYTSVIDDEIRNHIIDRTFVDKGIRWIVDYKTTSHAVEDDQLLAYQLQLARYRDLYREDADVRCAIWLTDSATLMNVL